MFRLHDYYHFICISIMIIITINNIIIKNKNTVTIGFYFPFCL